MYMLLLMIDFVSESYVVCVEISILNDVIMDVVVMNFMFIYNGNCLKIYYII